jgi:2-polyprenyl-3-methyl-5-hydroxy-6-metoxy-1,4-benzoquinol methylase
MSSRAPAVAHAFHDLHARARMSRGRGAEPIYACAARAMADRGLEAVTVADVGCGRGDLLPFIADRCSRYVGVDAVRYDGFPEEADFVGADLNAARELHLPGGPADVVISLETIEHLENPRAFARLLVTAVRPGGWILLSTPNQRSALSLATLVSKGQFSHFQDVHYPAHLTALLEVDLRRIAAEIGLEDVSIAYTGSGRVVFSSRHYPRWLSRALPRACSDNLLLAGRRPAA